MRRSDILALVAIAALLAAAPLPGHAAGIIGKPGKTYAGKPGDAPRTGYKWMDDRKSKPNCAGCTFRDLVIKPDRFGIELTKSASSPIRIENSVFEHRKPTTKPGDDAAGLKVADGAKVSVYVVGSTFSKFKRDIPRSVKYGQGDGIDCDEREARIEIWRSAANDNYDGGFDLKCIVTGGELSAARNYRNYRLWGKFTLGAIKSADPLNAHVFGSKGMNGTIDLLEASGATGAAVFNLEAGARPVVNACKYDFQAPTKVFSSSVRPSQYAGFLARMHPSCHPDASGYAVNTPAPPPPPAPEPVNPKLILWPTDLNKGGSADVRLRTPAVISAINEATGLTLKIGDVLKRLNPEAKDGPFLYLAP